MKWTQTSFCSGGAGARASWPPQFPPHPTPPHPGLRMFVRAASTCCKSWRRRRRRRRRRHAASTVRPRPANAAGTRTRMRTRKRTRMRGEAAWARAACVKRSLADSDKPAARGRGAAGKADKAHHRGGSDSAPIEGWCADCVTQQGCGADKIGVRDTSPGSRPGPLLC